MTSNRPSKPAKDSIVTMTEIVLPEHTNALGTIFGGQVMAWIDIAGAIAAGRHARRVVVTASVDTLNFVTPIRLGQIVEINAMVNYAGRTSMETGIRVDAEDPLTGERRHAMTAYMTFVALDKTGAPSEVPGLLTETDIEKRRFTEAQRRRESRLKLAQEIKKHREKA